MSPKTCRDLHPDKGVLFGSGALVGGAAGMLAFARHAQISFRRPFIAGSCCSGEQRPADGSDARVNHAIEPSVAPLFRVGRGIYVEEHGNEYTTAN